MVTCGKFTFSTVVAIVICMSKHTVHVVLCAIALCYVIVLAILYCACICAQVKNCFGDHVASWAEKRGKSCLIL